MCVTNITDVYDNITSSNYTEYDNISTSSNCTNNEINIDNIIPTILLRIPSGLSFLFLMSSMVFTLGKLLFKNE